MAAKWLAGGYNHLNPDILKAGLRAERFGRFSGGLLYRSIWRRSELYNTFPSITWPHYSVSTDISTPASQVYPCDDPPQSASRTKTMPPNNRAVATVIATTIA